MSAASGLGWPAASTHPRHPSRRVGRRWPWPARQPARGAPPLTRPLTTPLTRPAQPGFPCDAVGCGPAGGVGAAGVSAPGPAGRGVRFVEAWPQAVTRALASRRTTASQSPRVRRVFGASRLLEWFSGSDGRSLGAAELRLRLYLRTNLTTRASQRGWSCPATPSAPRSARCIEGWVCRREVSRCNRRRRSACSGGS